MNRPEPLENVWRQLKLGPVLIRNRIFVSGHTTNFAINNAPTPRHLRHYLAMVEGGVGLVFTEAIRVHPTACEHGALLSGYLSSTREQFRSITDAVRNAGGRIFAQLVHPGRHGGSEKLWAPSPKPWGPGARIPHAMTHEEIAEVVRHYAVSAENMISAGFDGIEVHLGHGHLPQQFLSPVSNERSDEYGGCLENRLRFAAEVVSAVRAVVPSTRALGLRVSADEFIEGGLSIEDTCDWVGRLMQAVSIDFLSVSQSHYVAGPSLATQIPDCSFEAGAFLHLPRQIKQKFPALPVLGIARVENLELAEAALSSGSADMIGMTRAHIADPTILTKWRQGKESEVRPCLYCNQGCIGKIERQLPLSCVVNPEVGSAPRDTTSSRDMRGAKILVVGGGPAGLSAAKTLADAGASVELWEASSELGGNLRWIKELPGHGRHGDLLCYYQATLVAGGVVVRCNQRFEWTPALRNAFDYIVIATGARNASTSAPENIRAMSFEDAASASFAPIDHVVILDRYGSRVGVSLATKIRLQGSAVTLLSDMTTLLPNVSVYSRYGAVDRLKQLDIAYHLGYELTSWLNQTVTAQSLLGATELTIPGVTTIIDSGITTAPPPIPATFAQRCILIGDAYAPRTLLESIHEGADVIERLKAQDLQQNVGRFHRGIER